MTAPFHAMLKRDLLLAARRAGDIATPLMFFVVVVTVFPLGLTPSQGLLRELAPGVIWVSALLASLLGLEMLFRDDFEDGTLEQMLLSPVSLGALALVRVFAHWVLTGLPLVVAGPVIASMLGYPARGLDELLFGLLLGTPVLSLLGAIGAALTVGLGRGGLLMPILIVPLAVPVLIFGARSAAVAGEGGDVSGPLYLLGAMLALAVTLAPFAIGGALRISHE